MMRRLWQAGTVLALLLCVGVAWAAPDSAPAIQRNLGGASRADTSAAVRILLGLTVLSLAPAILMSMTSFIRIVIVLSMLRHALGMQETPGMHGSCRRISIWRN